MKFRSFLFFADRPREGAQTNNGLMKNNILNDRAAHKHSTVSSISKQQRIIRPHQQHAKRQSVWLCMWPAEEEAGGVSEV